MLQTIVNIIGILGFLLAMTSLGWQIWIFRQTHTEKIRGNLSITAVCISQLPGKNVPALQLDVINVGNVPVFLKPPTLCWGSEVHRIGDTLVQLMFHPCYVKKPPLQPGDSMRYILPANSPMFLKASQQPKKSVWVSVESQKGILVRLGGEELDAYIEVLSKEKEQKTFDD